MAVFYNLHHTRAWWLLNLRNCLGFIFSSLLNSGSYGRKALNLTLGSMRTRCERDRDTVVNSHSDSGNFWPNRLSPLSHGTVDLMKIASYKVRSRNVFRSAKWRV